VKYFKMALFFKSYAVTNDLLLMTVTPYAIEFLMYSVFASNGFRKSRYDTVFASAKVVDRNRAAAILTLPQK
jgi:hypothetical protein